MEPVQIPIDMDVPTNTVTIVRRDRILKLDLGGLIFTVQNSGWANIWRCPGQDPQNTMPFFKCGENSRDNDC